ncbi:MAG: low molecular weight phosphotyrosine protein phosphatase [Planctomycetota bacterium]|nr:MAG: low molecular weight phosphotyrosine protein phosphatase [Planctomycetota bacterium]
MTPRRPTHNDARTSVLFVCLGNICRSPIAEGVFLHLARERGVEGRFLVDSCGTGGWHVGEPPDPRARAAAERHGVRLVSRARRLDPGADFARFDWLIPMDRQNKKDLLAEGAPADRVRLLRAFDPALAGAPERELDVPDPYWDEADGFDTVFGMIRAACGGMLDELSSD